MAEHGGEGRERSGGRGSHEEESWQSTEGKEGNEVGEGAPMKRSRERARKVTRRKGTEGDEAEGHGRR